MHFTAGVARRVLPNGLVLLVQRYAPAPVVAVVTHVRAGYFDEPDEWVGISHVLEHMYFKGTAVRGPGEIARDIQRVGGYVNAGTSYDMTTYYVVMPSTASGLERALDVQADALMHAAIDAQELARELEVIVQEANRKLDTPSAVAAESLYAELFRTHRMRRWRIGTEEGLRRLNAAALRAYYRSRYTPDRVVVSIVGDVEVERAAELAATRFGAWDLPAQPVPPSPAEEGDRAAALRVLRGDVERPLAALGWRTVGTLHPDAAGLDFVAALLGSGRGSSLYRAVRMPGLATRVGASHFTPTEVGVFEIDLTADRSRLDAAVERTLDVVEALAAQGPAEEELARARSLVAMQWSRRLESTDGRAAALCAAEALGGVHLLDERYRAALAVSGEEVRRAVAEYLGRRHAAGVLFLEPDGQTALENGGWPPAPGGQPGALGPPAGRAAWSAPNGASGEGQEQIGEVWRREADGADVLVRRTAGSGMVTVGLYFPGARAAEAEARAGLARLAARAAVRGVRDADAEQLAYAAEGLGGSLGIHVDAETVGWQITVRPEAVEPAAGILRRLALEPALDPAEVATERRQQEGDARGARDDMFGHPVRRVLAEAFPAHPYGLPTLGQPETVARLGADDLGEWFERLHRCRPVALAVGDLPERDLLRSLAALEGWPAGGGRVWAAAPRWRAGRGKEGRAKAQTALAMAFPGVPFDSPRRPTLRVLAALLGGLAGRLFKALREERSLGYVVAALPWFARLDGAMLTYVATAPEREDEAREAMLAELARLGTSPPGGEELERARQYAAGMLEVSRQRGATLAGEILETWQHGALETLAAAPARLREVTSDDVADAAGEVFLPGRRAEYVVRGTGEAAAGAGR